MTGTRSTRSRTHRALAPARSRAGLLHGVRLGLALTVLGITATAGAVVPIGVEDVAVPVAAYLLLAVTVELLRVRGHRHGQRAVRVMLLLDVIFLSGMISLAGGPLSVLAFLIPVHLVSASLLLSYQTGLRLALGYSLLLIGGHYLPALQSGEEVTWGSGGEAGLAVVGFWAIAIAVTVFAGMNERELLRSRERLEGLSTMAAALKEAREPTEVASILTTGVAAAFPGLRVAAVVEDRPHRWLLATSAADDVHILEERPFAVRSGVTLCRTLDAGEDPALAVGLPEARNVVLLPMVIEGTSLGVLGIDCGGPRRMRLASTAVSMLEHYASHGALALRNAHLLAEVTKLALSDPLTALANRRSFEEAFSREVARAQRSGEPMSVVMVDIDHFKQVNDVHGHDMGDEVLRHVGARMPAAARPMDVCARLGGEEFVVLLPGCAPVEAIHVAERLRESIASDAPLPVTASAGVATLGVHVVEPDDLLTAADEALYAAKHTGRDRVALSTRVPDGVLTASAAP